MTLPKDSTHSTSFGLDNGHTAFVNPYTGTVLGQADPGGGIVGLANRLHATLNNYKRMVPLPTVSAFWDNGPVMRDYVIGDLLLEIMGVWTMVLAASGIYLWWPRKKSARSMFGIRLKKKGRAKWRDLHAVPGVVLCCIVLVTLISGMAWSTYWGQNFGALSQKLTPNHVADTQYSSVGTRGDLDRLGNHITWNTGAIPIPASYAPPADGTLPTPISLDSVVKIADQEQMKPGYSVYFPDNSAKDDAGNPLYGTFMLANSWPRPTGEGHVVSLDEFSGNTLADQHNGDVIGALSYRMDTVVQWHMGVAWGLLTRILMTVMCVLAIWSVISALVMFLKRRRPGSAGLPRRPREVHVGKGLWVIIGVAAVVYPVWGVTALVILGLDRFVIRKVPRLRAAFGQR
jgi:uncharacterized iron-regulated membrane protein